MPLLLALLACETPNPVAAAAQEAMNAQLEAATVYTPDCDDSAPCDGSILATGALAATRTEGSSSVNLTLTVDDVTVDVHSPTGVDLADHIGAEVEVAVRDEWMMPASLAVTDSIGPVYVVEAGAGDAFSLVTVAYGDELGHIVDSADYLRTFRTIEVTTDDGVVSVSPGEVVSIRLDGAVYRFGAIAAYEIETIPDGEYMDCGGESPILSYELVRITDAGTFPTLQRPEGLEMAMYSGCG